MYRQTKQLGRGAFGEVWLCNDEQGNKVAVKFIPCHNIHGLNEASKEAGLLQDLNHPNIVRCYDHFIQDDQFCLVLEYCSQGTLSQRLKKGPVPYDLLVKWTAQLISAMSYLHSMGVVHRDIKPDNILISETDDIKIADFGLSKLMESIYPDQFELFKLPKFLEPNFVDDYAATVCGTKLYMAPEVFERHYNDKADVFSMGLVFYVMVTRCYVRFSSKNVLGLTINGLYIGQALRQDPSSIGYLFQEDVWQEPGMQDFQDLIELMLEADYQRRPSSEDLEEMEGAEELEDDVHGVVEEAYDQDQLVEAYPQYQNVNVREKRLQDNMNKPQKNSWVADLGLALLDILKEKVLA